MQNVLFWMEYETLMIKWEAPHIIYVISTLASLAGMAKAIYVYYLRYEVVIRGFRDDQERIDDYGLARELSRRGSVKKLNKVLQRMQNQGQDLEQLWTLLFMVLNK